MREHKYRAWLNGRKMVVTSYDFVNGVATGLGWDIREGEDESTWATRDIEQFTGLKDKNGREIYEGDIVSIVRYGGELQTKGDIFEESGVFRVRNGYAVADTNILGQFSSKISEVVGNIHENAELLK